MSANRRIESWHHAVTREIVDDQEVYAIREVYTDAGGAVVTWTDRPVAAIEDSHHELIETIERMAAAVRSGRVFDIETREWVGP